MEAELLEEMGQLWDFRQLSGIRELKIRCSEARNLKSLKKLSLRSVSLNMDRLWCKDFATNWSGQEMAFLLGPFDDLRKLIR